jgi:hypothetical protein
MFLLSSSPTMHYPLSRKTDPGNPLPKGLTGMRRNNTPPSQREWKFYTSSLSAHSQISMNNRRNTMPGPFTTSEISMANPMSECIILPWSNQHYQSGIMSTQCYSFVDVCWSFTTPFCFVSHLKSYKKLSKPHCFISYNTSCYILCLCCTKCHYHMLHAQP